MLNGDAAGRRRTGRMVAVVLGVALSLGAAVGLGEAFAASQTRAASAAEPVLSPGGGARAASARRSGPASHASSRIPAHGRTAGFRRCASTRLDSRRAGRIARASCAICARKPACSAAQLSSDQSLVLAVVTQQAGQRLFCARGGGPPTGGLCVPRGLRRWVTAISAGELYTVGGGARDRPARASRPVTAGVARTCAGARKIRAFTPGQLSSAYGVDPLHRTRADRLRSPR